MGAEKYAVKEDKQAQPVRSKKMARQKKVAALIVKSAPTQNQMAVELGVSQKTISLDIKEIEDRWMKENAENLDVHKERVVRRLEFVLREAEGAWQRSKEKERRETIRESDSSGNEITTQITNQVGDPRYLKMFQDAAVKIAGYRGVRSEELNKRYDVTILPKLPEDTFARFGLKAQRELGKEIDYHDKVEVVGTMPDKYDGERRVPHVEVEDG